MTKGWGIALAVLLIGFVLVTAAWAWPTYTAVDWSAINEFLPFGGGLTDFAP